MTALKVNSTMIKWLISIAIGALFLVIPEQGAYTHQLKVFLVITAMLLAIIAFELVNTLAISILMPILWLVFSIAPANVIFSPWLGSTMLMIVGALFMSASLEDSGLLKRFTYFIMCKIKGGFFALLVGITLCGVLLNVFTAGRAYLILPPLAYSLCVALDMRGKRAGAAIAMACMIGACTSHAYTYQATMMGLITKMGADYLTASDITPVSMMVDCWPLLLVSIAMIWVIAKWYKPEKPLGEVTYFQEKLAEMGEISRREKWNALMLVLVCVYTFTVPIHKLDINFGFALIPWMVLLPGVNAADEDTVKKVNLPIIFFCAACMGIGTVAASLGMGEAIVTILNSILGGNDTPFAIMAILFIVVFALNFLMTPMAILSLMTPIILGLAVSLGYSPVPFAFAINACTEAIIFPYEYIPYLLVFAFGMISMKDFIKLNAFRSAAFFAGFLLILVPYWMVIGAF